MESKQYKPKPTLCRHCGLPVMPYVQSEQKDSTTCESCQDADEGIKYWDEREYDDGYYA